MKQVKIVGSFFGTSGYVSHVRQLANALSRQGVEVLVDCAKPQGWEMSLTDRELAFFTTKEKDCVILFVGQPQYLPFCWSENDDVIPFVIWEGDRIPSYWVPYLLDERVKQIWVPSQHVADAILKTAETFEFRFPGLFGKDARPFLQGKLRTVPHGVDTSLFLPRPKPEKFTFFCSKGWAGSLEDRGGVQYLIKAFCEEFSKDEKVELRVKLNPAYFREGFNLNQEMMKIKIDNPNLPEVKVNVAGADYKYIPSLYEGDVFVCPTRCEAFGLTGLEAHSAGMPTIQTGYGGQVSYMTSETDFVIPYVLEETKEDLSYEGVKWATPDLASLRRSLRYAFENRVLMAQMGLKAREKAVEGWTWESAARKAVKALEQYPL